MRYAKILALIPALLLCAAPVLSEAAIDIDVAVNLAPPPIPIYDQPPLPAPGYLWTPGYWAWDGMDYYWVPGTWVEPPASDMLWTPGYWGWRDGFYAWNPGYWGPEVGYYGGIDYGYGYGGSGYRGGYWHGGAFFYNRSVANFGRVNIVNVYTSPVPHWGGSRVSFNGGEGGLRAQPSERERRFMSERHAGLTSQQRDHQEHAQGMRELHVSQNGGRPGILTTERAADFGHPGPGLHNHQTPRSEGGGMPFHGDQGRPGGEAREFHGDQGRPSGEAREFHGDQGRPGGADRGIHGNPARAGGETRESHEGEGARIEHQGPQPGQSPAMRGNPGQQGGNGQQRFQPHPQPAGPQQQPHEQQHMEQPHPQQQHAQPTVQQHEQRPAGQGQPAAQPHQGGHDAGHEQHREPGHDH